MRDVSPREEGSWPVDEAGTVAIARLSCFAKAALLVLVASASTPLASATSHGSAAVAEVAYAGGLLSVHVVDAPVREVLEAVAEASAIDLSLRAPVDERITLSFTGLALDAGLRRILGGRSTVMLYGEGVEQDRLVEVRVYGAAGPSDPMAGTFERLHAALASPDRRARMRAIDAVRRYDSPAAIDIVADALVNDTDPVVRARAANVLASIGGEEAAEVLAAGLGDQVAEVRAEVIRGLGMVGGERATLAIGQALFASDEPEVRVIAVEALAAQGTEQARRFLEAALDDDDETVRERARLALRR